MKRGGFTLIELLAVVAIISIVVSMLLIGSSKRNSNLNSATRAIFATIRQARSIALVSQKPSVITYSTIFEDGETLASVELESVKLMSSKNSVSVAETLSGGIVSLLDPASVSVSSLDKTKQEDSDEVVGETIEEILFAPIHKDVLVGIAVKVIVDEEEKYDEDVKKAVNSVFSNADSLLNRYRKNETKKEKEEEKKEVASSNDFQAPVSLSWEPNGRVEPHVVWVYEAGKSYDTGFAIRVDRFGAAKVLSEDDE